MPIRFWFTTIIILLYIQYSVALLTGLSLLTIAIGLDGAEERRRNRSGSIAFGGNTVYGYRPC